MLKEKIIHQIYFDNFNLKLSDLKTLTNEKFYNIIQFSKYKNKSNLLSWLEKNHDWKYILWNKNMIIELVKKNHKNIYSYFINLKDEKMKQFGSYLIIYNYGGIFVQNNIVCLKSINKLIKYFKKYNVILNKFPKLNNVEKSYYKFVCNLDDDLLSSEIFLSNKNNNFWLILIDNIINCKNITINNHTGDVMLSKTFFNMKENSRDIVLANNIFLLPCDPFDKNCNVLDISYARKVKNNDLLYNLKYDIYSRYFKNVKKVIIFIISIIIIINIYKL